jgi:5-methylcytosine-specific restriction endonuclease McrA
MPCDYKNYPDNWKEIREKILIRACNRCELCNAPNGVKVVRDRERPVKWISPGGNVEASYDSQFYYMVKIVLTIAHLDQDTKNNEPWNLLALCQRCHLKIDLPFKMKKRRAP